MPRYPLEPARGPKPITTPSPRPVPGVWGGVGRLAGRAIPWIGVGILAYDLWKWWNGRDAGYNLAGWDLLCDSPGRHDAVRFGIAPVNTALCGIGNQANFHPLGTPIPENSRTIWYGEAQSASRWRIRQMWNKNDSSLPPPEWVPETPPAFLPPVFPVVPPWVDPLPLPIGVPVPTPVPPPYRWIPRRRNNPNRTTEQSSRGYNSPGQSPASSPSPVALPRPVPPRTKERKVMSIYARAVLQLWSAATEVPDWVDGFYEALPKKLRTQLERNARKNGQDVNLVFRTYAVYRHFDQVDLEIAFKNSVYNIVEDYGWGKVHQLLKKAGLGSGFGGVNYVRQHLL